MKSSEFFHVCLKSSKCWWSMFSPFMSLQFTSSTNAATHFNYLSLKSTSGLFLMTYSKKRICAKLWVNCSTRLTALHSYNSDFIWQSKGFLLMIIPIATDILPVLLRCDMQIVCVYVTVKILVTKSGWNYIFMKIRKIYTGNNYFEVRNKVHEIVSRYLVYHHTAVSWTINLPFSRGWIPFFQINEVVINWNRDLNIL